MLFDNPDSVTQLHNGTQRRYKFPNGYGASVIMSSYSYGGDEGLWEVAVTDHSGALVYDTPVTSDVIGHLTESEVESVLIDISNLPERGRKATFRIELIVDLEEFSAPGEWDWADLLDLDDRKDLRYVHARWVR